MESIARAGRSLRLILGSVSAAIALSGCLTGGDVIPEPSGPGMEQVSISGSVGDGPIVGASMQVLTRNGNVLAEFESDVRAAYSVSVDAQAADFPLRIEAEDGTDLVTNLPPDFRLLGVVLAPSSSAISNVNPHSTLAIEAASLMPGGATGENLILAGNIVASQLNFGLSTLLQDNSMSVAIDRNNVAEMVRASEALGELVRRTRDWMLIGGAIVSGDQVVRAIAADLVDGVLDGRGAVGTDARLAAIANVVAAQVALETLSNELRVNGQLGNVLMTDAINVVTDSGAQRLGELTSTAEMNYQAQVGLAAALRVTNDQRIESLLLSSLGFTAGLDASLVRALLPPGYWDSLDGALNLIANGDAAVLESVNSVVRNGEVDPEPGQNVAPTISGQPPTSVQVGALYSFTPTASDADGDAITFNASNLPGWLSIRASDGRIQGVPDVSDAGVFTDLLITVSDGELQSSLGPFAITVSVDAPQNAPPTISGEPQASVLSGALYSFTPSASDPDGDEITFSASNLPGWLSIRASDGRIQGIPGDSDVGTYSGIVVTVSDGELQSSLGPFSITVNVDIPQNRPPTIGGIPDGTAFVQSAYSFTPDADDPDGDNLTFSIQNLPAWASFDTSTGRLTGTPSVGDVNVYTDVVIVVSDGDASATLGPFSIDVQAVATGSATLNWGVPTQNTDGSPLTNLSGFRVYWGKNGAYTNSATINNPSVTTYVVENLSPGVWSFVTTAFNTSGTESGFSNAATKVID